MHRFSRSAVLALSAALALAVPNWSRQSAGGTVAVPAGRPTRPPPPPSPPQGMELPKPDGSGTFFSDPHQKGRASKLHLVELEWGRLVDVHGLDAAGRIDPRPVFRDFVISELVQGDGARYRLALNPLTLVMRLVILRQRGAPEPAPGAGTFETLLQEAAAHLVPILPRAEDDSPPFSFVARNAVLVARFDDLLEDSATAEQELIDTVRLFTRALAGPNPPFAARLRFDPNHGGIAGHAFHSTRVLIDLTVSEFEASSMAVPQPVNALGLPASQTLSSNASAILRIPTRIAPGIGQFAILTNLRGNGLSTTGNGPVDLASPTEDVVRAMRAGNDEDPSNGFLLDLIGPSILGSFPVMVTAAVPDPAGEAGFAFLLDWTFSIQCGGRALPGDGVIVGSHFLEVLALGPRPDVSGHVQGVRVRAAGADPVAAGELLGQGLFLAPLRPSAIDRACWLAFAPQPSSPPADGVSPSAQVMVRFTEPMRPESVTYSDTLRLVRGDSSQGANAGNIVVAEVLSSADLTEFALIPLLPLAHTQGSASPYHVELDGSSQGVRDLAGNGLARSLAPVDFTLDPLAPSQASDGIVLSFASTDELPPIGAPDLRGQFFFDLGRGVIRPRPVAFTGFPVDRSNPVPSIMPPFLHGVQSPLVPLGSKLQAVWRYCDLGWSVRDETKYNLDVVGISWAPVNGQVLADFFPLFEIALAHSARLPDEDLDSFLLPKYPSSGVLGAPNLFTDNILADPLSPQRVVHVRSLGYSVNPVDAFLSSSGTVNLPYPLNRGGGPLLTYTWRDTSVLAQAGPAGAGVPLDVEVGPPLFLEPQAGALAPAGAVPSIGLPLLMEFRCFPEASAIGLNALDIALAINSSALPAFRAYSSGGYNTSGQPVAKDPDLELVPSGGFNPTSNPPGLPSLSAENTFYMGQLDLVTRVSRVHSAWIDTDALAPDYFDPLVGADTPGASSVVLEYRGASAFSGPGVGDEFNATKLDAYGEITSGRTPLFFNGISTWSDDIDALDGARYLQVRITLANDLGTGLSPELGSLGIAFAE